MALTITRQPPAICFAGNLQDILANTTEDSETFTLSIGGDELVSETYTPDNDGNIRIAIRTLLEEQLSLHLPEGNVYEQQDAVKDVECLLGGEPIDFRIIKGGVDRESLDTGEFLDNHWLTWQPQRKEVKYRDPEWLSYYAREVVTVQVRGYFPGGTEETAQLAALDAGALYAVLVTFERLHELFSEQPIYCDVWVQNSEEGENTWRQRYVLTDREYEHDDVFVFENTLGGIDTIRFTGEKTLLNKQEFDTGLFFDEIEQDYNVNPDRAYEKNTGYFRSRRHLFWSQDFFSSMQKYRVQGNELRRILTRDPEFSATVFDLIAFDFIFAFTRQVEYLDWIADEVSDHLVIIGPDDEEYYLIPKLWLFPILEDPSDAIFPVQVEGEQAWQGLRFQTIMEHILDQIDIPSGDRIINAGTLVIDSPTAATLTGAQWVKDGVTYTYTGPVTLQGTPDAPLNRVDIIYTQNSNTVGYLDGDDLEEPPVPNAPGGQMVLHQIIRLNTGEDIVTPQQPSDPQTANQSGQYENYAPIWQQTLQVNTYYNFQVAFTGWASDFTSNRQRPLSGTLHVRFVTGASNREVDPNRVMIQTIDTSPVNGDFVLVQTSSTQARIYVKKTAFFQTLTFRFLVRTATVSPNSLMNGGLYAALPSGDKWHSWNGRSYIPSTGNIRFDRPRSYGMQGSPVSGNLTIAIAYADDSCMAKVLHHAGTEPSISKPSAVALRKLSGDYVEDEDNYFLFIVDTNEAGEVTAVNYTISQNEL